MEHINICCVNEEIFNFKRGSSCMGGRFAVSVRTRKYIFFHMYSSQHCASVTATDMQVPEMGTRYIPRITCWLHMVSVCLWNVLYWMESACVLYSCNVCVMENIPPEVLWNISCINSAMWKNKIQTSGKIMTIGFNAGQKENAETVVLLQLYCFVLL